MVTRPASRRRDGFSMVEVLMVISIIVLLMAMVMVAANANKKSAFRKSTEAFMTRIVGALEDYKSLKGRYPPDGYDSEVLNDEGVPIQGSACLYHFLTREIEVVKRVSGKVRTSREEAVLEVKDSETVSSEEEPSVIYLADAWGKPIQYDNTENGDFVPIAWEGLDLTLPDPREDPEKGAVDEAGIQDRGYDLWSYADVSEKQYEKNQTLSPVIGSWNLGEKGSAEYEEEGAE